ncbi:MAG: PAS domain-containing protein [Candidatus Brocadia sp. AMX2]|uniref:PAS domain-containing protein n=1 Tax=Candidatus Brocadia sinica JPN1 TaxID=1197129 RepID=A0ABQ0JYZ0_9BACT|nr:MULTISPECIES: PAS domain-containing protein [Brocadia]MBC6932263.1 PAS domain-containing protein [Candidatus Brocadia sp.]MBL1168535.1 PAS domain-containing protein [Candidatus Brocadia sp. AMX1]MCK6467295.1 PAS domain-containing protein [Candidatus Brocadia sinica]NOG40179.1 PAS domain-containing protein [Planctomycetota bacterium]KAA0243699.1 MAG: PAS domain-containing protein [Candidatus Brocadia sp. AMX2]
MSSISDEKKLYHRIKALSDAFLQSSRALDYKSFLRTATRHFKVFTGADASVLMLNNDENLTPVCSVGIPFSKVKDACLPCSTRLKDIITRPVIDVRYTSFMNTPLIHNRKLIGLSAVFSIIPEKFHAFEYDKYESLLMTTLASYIAVSIENATLMNTFKSIERSKIEWESAFDAINDLISIHDTDFTILRANKAVAKKFNMDIKSIVGKKCYKIFHGTEEPWKICPHRKSMEKKTPCTEEIVDPHMCGIFNITAFPYFNDAGKFIGSIHVTKDITMQKKLLGQVTQ